jgi:hypothetical protein
VNVLWKYSSLQSTIKAPLEFSYHGFECFSPFLFKCTVVGTELTGFDHNFGFAKINGWREIMVEVGG